MSTAVPSPDTLHRARTYWEQGRSDLAAAKRQLRAGDGLASSFLSLQAAINALTCLCYLHGEYRVPNHSAAQLLGVLQGLAPDWEAAALQEAALALEAVHGLSPFAAGRDATEEQRQGRLYYDHGSAILNEVRRYLKRHRKRFFAP